MNPLRDKLYSMIVVKKHRHAGTQLHPRRLITSIIILDTKPIFFEQVPILCIDRYALEIVQILRKANFDHFTC